MKLKPAAVANVPSELTVTVAGTLVAAVVPIFSEVMVLEPGVKPAPEIVTVVVGTACELPRVIAGVSRTVKVVVAVRPDASVTVMASVCATVDDGTMTAAFAGI